jgi:hypothetical protein
MQCAAADQTPYLLDMVSRALRLRLPRFAATSRITAAAAAAGEEAATVPAAAAAAPLL